MTEDAMPEMPQIDPMTLPPAIRVNLLMNDMMNLVDHMTQLKALIDQTMGELMHGHEDSGCGDPTCADPDCDEEE